MYRSLFPRLKDSWDSSLIQQGVVNGDPDMDAIFRLTRKMTMTPLNVSFDSGAPPVFLPEGVFSPFNSFVYGRSSRRERHVFRHRPSS